jgi:hypothetical protein
MSLPLSVSFLYTNPTKLRTANLRKEKRGRLLSTSMHNRLFDSFDILHAFGARISQTSLLLHRQRINVSAQKERLALAILEHSGEPVATDMGMDVESLEGFEVLDDSGGSFSFAERELGMGVEPFVFYDQYVKPT